MGISTVKLNGTTLMTVNDTTATASDVATGKNFYAADGTKTTGTASGTAADSYDYGELTQDLFVYYPKVKQLLYSWDLTDSLVDTVSGAEITLSGATRDSGGIHITAVNNCAILPVHFRPYFEYQFDIGNTDFQNSGTHGRFIMVNNICGLIYRNNGKWSAYLGNAWSTDSATTNKDYLANKTVTIKVGTGAPQFLIDDEPWFTSTKAHTLISDSTNELIRIGSTDGNAYFNAAVTGIRVYWGGDFIS